MAEKVLVIERKTLEKVGIFNGVMPETKRYMEAFFAPGATRFVLRSDAENDPSLKQIIPYVIMSCHGMILSYVRGKRAGETRLVEKRSIGIGGHINPVDDDIPLFGSFNDIYMNAVKREVAEEVRVDSDYSDEIIALLNDDSNEVGSVHIGVVHRWELKQPLVSKKEQMINRLEFLSLPDLLALRPSMETWSQLCLDHLNGKS